MLHLVVYLVNLLHCQAKFSPPSQKSCETQLMLMWHRQLQLWPWLVIKIVGVALWDAK